MERPSESPLTPLETPILEIPLPSQPDNNGNDLNSNGNGTAGVDENGNSSDAGSPATDGANTAGTFEMDEDDDNDMEKQMMDYEQQRLATIKANQALLVSLGLDKPQLPSAPAAKRPRPSKPRTKPLKQEAPEPSRRSGRIKAQEDQGFKTEYKELPNNFDDRFIKQGRVIGVKKEEEGERGPALPPGKAVDMPRVRYEGYKPAGGNKKRKRIEEDESDAEARTKREEKEYEAEQAEYAVQQPKPGRRDDGSGRLIFHGRWEGIFEPNVTPEEVLRLGSFGGSYYADDYSRVLKAPLPAQADIDSLPSSYTRIDASSSDSKSHNPDFTIEKYLTSPTKDPSINRYGRAAGQGLKEWEQSGWIWAGDPRGWMQWYVRFYEGRRCEDDRRQIDRWLKLAGPNGRFSRMVMKKITFATGSGGAIPENTAVEDDDVATVNRQVCWQWGWECNREEWKRRLEEGSA